MAYGKAQIHNLANAEVSPAAPGTVAGAIKCGNIGVYRAVTIVATLQGATGGPLDVYIQSSWDGGATWWDLAHFTQLIAGAAATTVRHTIAREQVPVAPVAIGTQLVPLLAANTFVQGEFGDMFRVVYVAGASTSAGAAQTISVNGVRQNY